MFYRTAGDFVAIKPPKNDEVEILGYIYKQPSTKAPTGGGNPISKAIKLN